MTGAAQAVARGLVDECFGATPGAFVEGGMAQAHTLAASQELAQQLKEKRTRRAARDEAAKLLADYRREELERMKLNFYGFDPSYHVARYHFVEKLPKARTPAYLARRGAWAELFSAT